MTEFFAFLDTIASAGWVYLCALLTVAVALFIFDRQPKKAGVDQAASSREQIAA